MNKRDLINIPLKTGTFELPNGEVMPLRELNMAGFIKVMELWNAGEEGYLKANAMYVVAGCDWFDADSEEDLKAVLQMPYDLVIKIADAVNSLGGKETAEERKKNLKAIQT